MNGFKSFPAALNYFQLQRGLKLNYAIIILFYRGEQEITNKLRIFVLMFIVSAVNVQKPSELIQRKPRRAEIGDRMQDSAM